MNRIERAFLGVALAIGVLGLACDIIVICMALTGTKEWP